MSTIITSNDIEWNYDLVGEGEVLLFIHGWGVDGRIWRQQTKSFSKSYKVLTIDLPGHGKSAWKNIPFKQMAADLKEILERLDLNDITVVGSSLGGLLSLKLYDIAPGKIKKMIFVGSMPKFAKSEEYPYGLDVSELRKLYSQVEADHSTIINVFFRSLFTSEERKTRRFKWLQRFRTADLNITKEALLFYLDILEEEDLTSVLSNVRVPVHFINGREDNICSYQAINFLKEIRPEANIFFFDNCGHFPFLSKPYEFNEVLASMIFNVSRVFRKKKERNLIRRSFSDAAFEYDVWSSLHKEIAWKLVEQMKGDTKNKMILDVGMGTGWFTNRLLNLFTESRVIGLDFATGMIEYVKERNYDLSIIQANADFLPFKNEVFDLVTSNLAYQWVEDLHQAFNLVYGNLKNDGRFCISLFGQDTFKELFIALESAMNEDQKYKLSTMQRLPKEDYVLDVVKNAGFKKYTVYSEDVKVCFQDMMAIIRWIRNIGANVLRKDFFIGKQMLDSANKFYTEHFFERRGVYATFEVIWVDATK